MISNPLVGSKSQLGMGSTSLLAGYFSWLFLGGAMEDYKANALWHSMNNVGAKGKKKRQKHHNSHLSFPLLNAKVQLKNLNVAFSSFNLPIWKVQFNKASWISSKNTRRRVKGFRINQELTHDFSGFVFLHHQKEKLDWEFLCDSQILLF